MSDLVQSVFSALGKFTPYVLLIIVSLGAVLGVLFAIGIAINFKYIMLGIGIAAGLGLIYFLVKKGVKKPA
jgi:hypothetical protein